jgi:hypothetical protein
MGKLSKGSTKEDIAICMTSDRILDNGDFRQAWMVVYQ